MAQTLRVLGVLAVHMLEYKQYPQYENPNYLSTPTMESIKSQNASAFEYKTPSNTLTTSSTSQWKTTKFCEY